MSSIREGGGRGRGRERGREGEGSGGGREGMIIKPVIMVMDISFPQSLFQFPHILV